MTGFLAGIFTTSIPLHGVQRLTLMLPLCLSIAVIYKTVRTDHVAEVPKAAVVLWVTIVVGMCAVGAGLWLLFQLLV